MSGNLWIVYSKEQSWFSHAQITDVPNFILRYVKTFLLKLWSKLQNLIKRLRATLKTMCSLNFHEAEHLHTIPHHSLSNIFYFLFLKIRYVWKTNSEVGTRNFHHPSWPELTSSIAKNEVGMLLEWNGILIKWKWR